MEATTLRKKIHRAWIILVAMILIQSGIIGILLNCTGILFSAILSETGFRAGDLSLYYTIRSLVSAATINTACWFFFHKNSRVVLAVLGAAYCVSMGMMSCFSQLWQWYLAAIFAGIGSGCVPVIIPIVLNNWFHEKNGFVIGLTMAASGAVSAVFSPICSQLILTFGWRATAVIMAILSFCLVVFPSLLFLEKSPEKAGCLPYGVRPASESSPDGQPQDRAEQAIPPRYIFALCLLAIVAGGGLVQFNNQITTYAKSIGYTISVGAMMTSCCMGGNLLGKLIFGTLADRVGIYRAIRIYLAFLSASMATFLMFAHRLPILCFGTLFFGFAYSISTIAPSLLFLDVYGPLRYKKNVGKAQSANNIIFAMLSAAFPYVYDLTGEFRLVFVFGIGLCGISFLALFVLQSYARKTRQSIPERCKE